MWNLLSSDSRYSSKYVFNLFLLFDYVFKFPIPGCSSSLPINALLLSQAIIQGLRESGVFSSVIANAPTTISKDKFLASIDSSNSSRVVSPTTHTSRKIGRSRQQQTSARKVLEIETNATDEAAAVPPLSPPAWTMTTFEQ